MQINRISHLNNLQQNNLGFQSKHISKFARNMLLYSVLALSAASCNGSGGSSASSQTPQKTEINMNELAKHTDLTPEELNAGINAIKMILNSEHPNNVTYLGASYDKANDCSLVITYKVDQSTVQFIYNKQDKSFHAHHNYSYTPISYEQSDDKSFSIINRDLSNEKTKKIFTKLDYTGDGKLNRKHYIIEPTEGLVFDRNEKEIKQLTGLTKIEVNAVKNAILDIFNNKARYYKGSKTEYIGTEYNKKGKLYLKFKTLPDYEFAYYYDKEHKTFKPAYFKDKLDDPRIKLIRNDKDGSFTIVGNDGMYYCELNKDGKSIYEVEPVKENKKATQENPIETLTQNIKKIGMLSNFDADIIARAIYALGYSSIDKSGNIIYLNEENVTLRLNIKQKKDNRNVFAGIANKVTGKGMSEIYAIGLSWKPSDIGDIQRIEITKIRIVQDELDDNSPAYNKYTGTITTKTGKNEQNSTYDVRGTHKRPFIQNILNLNAFYDGNLTNSQVNKIYEEIRETRPEQKTMRIIEINKKTRKVTIKGG